MKDNHKLILFNILGFIICFNTDAQTDTIYVYEDVIVYDTVFIYDTIFAIPGLNYLELFVPKSISVLQLDTVDLQANLLLISGRYTATIPINRIILDENLHKNLKNSDSMKKLKFFGVVLYAFQTMVIAQTDFGISATGSIWWAKCNDPIGSVKFSPAFSAGLFLEHPLGNHFFIRPEISYTYLLNNYSYKAIIDTINLVTVGESESATNYHQISVPLQVGYKFRKVKPYIGFEYSYRMSQSWLKKSINSYGISGGVSYTISPAVSVALNYYHGLTKDFAYKGTIVNPGTTDIVGEYNNYWKSSRLELTLYYALNKKEKHEVNQQN